MKILLILLIIINSKATEFILEDINITSKQSTVAILPYAFSSEATGLTGGVIAIMHGYHQAQMTMYFTAFLGAKQNVVKNYPIHTTIEETQAKGMSFGIDSYKIPFSKRMFLSVLGVYAYYPKQKLYLNGENDSRRNLNPSNPTYLTPLQTQGNNNWIEVDMKYILPIGDSKDKVLPTIKVSRGLPINRNQKGGGVPFFTGQTILGTEFFYNKWTTDMLVEELEYNTNGIRAYLEHDNTDYPDNPSRGYNFMTKVSADFGIGNSTQSWNSLETEYSHYFELKNFNWSRQNVLAFNFWTAYSPSWKQDKDLNPGGVIDYRRPPMWEGARLGGWNRLRAYDSNRFNDKAALYFGTEYRVIPKYNPFKNDKWLPVNIDWVQTVLFAEAGRVAPEYYLDELTSNMKYDVGFSLRALAATVPVRFDLAVGEEGLAMWVMLKQPF